MNAQKLAAFMVGKKFRLAVSGNSVVSPGSTLWVTPGDEVTVVGQARYNCDFDDVRNMTFMVAYKSDSYDAPYHFPVRGHMLDLSLICNED